MAFELSYDDDFGGTHPSAYHRIISIVTDYAGERAIVTLATYRDAAARGDSKVPLGYSEQVFTSSTSPSFDDVTGDAGLDVAGENPRKKAYDQLKTLPAWSAATDV